MTYLTESEAKALTLLDPFGPAPAVKYGWRVVSAWSGHVFFAGHVFPTKKAAKSEWDSRYPSRNDPPVIFVRVASGA